LRSHLAEFGLIAPKGIGRMSQLLELANADAALPEEVKDAVLARDRPHRPPGLQAR
jgi:transposase